MVVSLGHGWSRFRGGPHLPVHGLRPDASACAADATWTMRSPRASAWRRDSPKVSRALILRRGNRTRSW